MLVTYIELLDISFKLDSKQLHMKMTICMGIQLLTENDIDSIVRSNKENFYLL
jgi:hypothetical protein